MLQGQWRSGGSRRSELCGHRGVWSGAVVGRTDGRTEESNVSTTSGAAGVYPQAGRKTAAVRGAHYPRSDRGNGGGSRARTNFRGGSAAGTVRLSTRPQRTGRRKASP